MLLLLGQPAFTPNVSDDEVNGAIKSALNNTFRHGRAAPLPFHTTMDRPGRFPEGCPIFCSLGGNDHNALGLVKHERSFDFILPNEPTLPLVRDAEIVPYNLVRASLERRMSPWTLLVRRLAEISERPVFQMESPPPFADDDHVSSRLDQFYLDRDPNARVVDRVLRYKLWRLSSSIMQGVCDHEQSFFVPAPEQCKDERGYLRREYYGEDATHGNERYGELQLQQMDEILARWECAAS